MDVGASQALIGNYQIQATLDQWLIKWGVTPLGEGESQIKACPSATNTDLLSPRI